MFITATPRQGEDHRWTTASSDLTIKRVNDAPALGAPEKRIGEAVVIRTQTIIRLDSTTTVTWTLGNDGPPVGNGPGPTGTAQLAPGGVEPVALEGTSSITESSGGGSGSSPSVNVVGVVLIVVVVMLVLVAALWYLCSKRAHG